MWTYQCGEVHLILNPAGSLAFAYCDMPLEIAFKTLGGHVTRFWPLVLLGKPKERGHVISKVTSV